MSGTIGGLIEHIGVYCQSNYDLKHQSQWGDGKGTIYGKLFTTYTWKDSESSPFFVFDPTYDFYESQREGVRIAADFTESQYRKRPYITDRVMLSCINYSIQQLRDDISFADALMIKFVRDKWDNDFDVVHGTGKLRQKIKMSLTGSSHGYIDGSRADQCWQHMALCAVYNI